MTTIRTILSIASLVAASAVGIQPAIGQSPTAPTGTSAERFAAKPEAGVHAPLFIENKGQWNRRARFLLRTNGLDMWVTDRGVVYDLYRRERSQGEDAARSRQMSIGTSPTTEGRETRTGHVVGVTFDGASFAPNAHGTTEVQGRYNYFIGNDRSKWCSNVRRYRGARIEGLYDRVDAVFYLDDGVPRYDLVVAPGGDPSQIRMSVSGTTSLGVNQAGSLVIGTTSGTIEQRELFAYQTIGGTTMQVACSFVVDGEQGVRFKTGVYDRTRPLVIDPLVFSTFLGGSSSEEAYGLAVDAAGNSYITGYTTDGATDYPTSVGAYDQTHNGNNDIFVTKLDAGGSGVVYSTLIGSAGSEAGYGIAVDGSGNAYIVGTASNGYPTTAGSFDVTANGSSDAVVTKLSPDGSSLLYSTYLGGFSIDAGYAIAIDASGSAYVTGYFQSENQFPKTAGAYDETANGNADVFVSKLNPSGSGLVYSTYIGGESTDWGYGIAVDATGNAYVTGMTADGVTDYPTTAGAFDQSHNGHYDAFVTKLNAAGNALVYSTLIGGSGEEQGRAIAVDAGGSAFITGVTADAATDYPTTSGAFDETQNGGTYDAFATKVNPAGSALVYSTLLGGSGEDQGRAIAVDGAGNAWIAGYSTDAATDYPTTAGSYDATQNGSNDAFISTLNPAGTLLLSSTFVGGFSDDRAYAIALDGNVYIAGTAGGGFPTTAGSFDQTHNGAYDVYVAKLSGITPPGSLYMASNSASVFDHTSGNSADIGLDYSSTPALRGIQITLEINSPDIQPKSVSLGSAIATPANWTFDYQITNGVTGSSIEVVLYGKTAADVLASATYPQLFVLNFDVPDLKLCDGALGGDVTTGKITITAVGSSKNDGAASTAGVEIDASRKSETVTINNTSSRGDVDCNDRLDVLDLGKTINVLAKRSTFEAWQKNRADMAPWSSVWANPATIFSDANNYGNNTIDVSDVVVMADAILNAKWPDNKALYRAHNSGNTLGRSNTNYDILISCIPGTDGVNVWIENRKAVSSLQFDLHVPDAPAALQAKLASQLAGRFDVRVGRADDAVRVVLYSLNGGLILPMRGRLLELPMASIDPSAVEVAGTAIAGDVASEPLVVETVMAKGTVDAGPQTGSGLLDLTAGPNPARENVTLGFTLSTAGSVTMRLIDAAGREVARPIVETLMPEGPHQVMVDVSSLPAGMYSVSLEAAEIRVTRGLVVVR